MKALVLAILVLGSAALMGCRAEGEIDTATNVGLAR
jgi:hypothetical protein